MCKKIKLQRLHHTTYTNQTGQDLNVKLKRQSFKKKIQDEIYVALGSKTTKKFRNDAKSIKDW